MPTRRFAWVQAAALAVALSGCASIGAQPALAPLPYHVGGRAVCEGGACARQWPGGYFETAFEGESIAFRIGPGDVVLRVLIDGQTHQTLNKPAPGLITIDGLPRGRHDIRIQVISENQYEASTFQGFFAPAGVRAIALPERTRRIEFIGDSHTVGYANTSTTRECPDAVIWDTTDTSQAFGPLIAAQINADYRVHAISGRGVVRNYNGRGGDTLPAAYDYALLNHLSRADDAGWTPDTIVIALGTNDFSTPLRDGEPWHTRQALHDDFERSYAAFLASLRAKYPGALIVVWSYDQPGGEIETQARRGFEHARANGVERLVYVPIHGLAMDACHWHPGLADHRAIADQIGAAIEAAAH